VGRERRKGGKEERRKGGKEKGQGNDREGGRGRASERNRRSGKGGGGLGSRCGADDCAGKGSALHTARFKRDFVVWCLQQT